jgi:hypothetical protein
MYFDPPEAGTLKIAAQGYRRTTIWVLTVNTILLIAITPWIGEMIDFIASSLVHLNLS